MTTITLDWVALQQAGRLDQTCPKCGLVEAAGSYCSFCHHIPMAAFWHMPKLTEAQRATIDKMRAARTKK